MGIEGSRFLVTGKLHAHTELRTATSDYERKHF